MDPDLEADTGRRTLLVRVTGRDRPGITAGLFGVLATADVEVYDIEQVVVRDRLTLDVLLGVVDVEPVLKELLFFASTSGLQVDFEVLEQVAPPPPQVRHAVTVIAPKVGPAAVAAVASAIAQSGGNIDRITRLSRYPVVSFELVVSGADPDRMRAGLMAAAATHHIDVAIQREGLERRAKRLVVLDVDSTLIQDEIIDLLAEEAGCVEEVRRITDAAMAGELEFTAALQRRVALLAGLDSAAIERVRARIRFTPGARTFVRTLKRLGFRVAIVSGGFTVFTDWIGRRLGIDRCYGNELEIVDGRITGRLVGPVLDRRRKAELLEEIAAAEGIPLEQTVAVGDGANDLDMLARAGLGIAFNARPAVRAAADTALSVPYLDAILFLLGIRREDIEAADADDPDRSRPVPVPGVPPV